MQKGQYRYGLHRFTGNVVYIFAAEKHSEDYICPECREAFVPVKGEVNAKHFRHKVDSECIGGQETAIHFGVASISAEFLDRHPASI